MLDAILAGRLIGASLACGLNLYATIAALGLASRLGWIDSLPVGLRGLEHGLIIATALLLLTTELVASTVHWGHSVWESAHTVIRPAGALALFWIALEGAPPVWRVSAALTAASVAFAMHAAKLGLRIVITAHRGRRMAATVAEAALAGALVLLVLLHTVGALTVVASLLVLLALVGPALVRGAVFGARAVIARLRGFFGARRWRAPAEMPGSLRALLATPTIASPYALALRAAFGNGRVSGAWRNGWLVFDGLGAAFLHRALPRARRIPLPAQSRIAVRKAFLADIVVLTTDDARLTLYLLKDGPPIEATLGALRTNQP